MKKGEITVSYIVGLILLIAGAAIIFMIFKQINWTGTVDTEACHQSVIFRGTLPSLAQNYMPLKCQTEKICITSKLIGGNCPDYGEMKGITRVRVSNLDQVQKVLAENLVNCWSMMGEGKVSLFSQYLAQNFGVAGVYPTCVICTRVAFDYDSLKDSKIDLSNMDIIKYMQTHEIPSQGKSYYDYLVGEDTAKIAVGENISLPQIIPVKDDSGQITGYKADDSQPTTEIELLSDEEVRREIELQKDSYALQNHQLAIFFMQISAPKHGESILNVGKIALLGGTAAGTVAPRATMKIVKGVSNVCTKGGWVSVACGAILAVAGVVQQGNVAYNRAYTSSVCGDVSVGSEARDGCSVIRIENYDEESLKNYCSVFESIP